MRETTTVGRVAASSDARFYDPTTGQFLSRDPLVAQTREAYGYVGNSPLNRTDPSGQAWGIPDWVPVVGGGCIAVGNSSYEDSNGDTQTCDNSDNQNWSGNVLAGAGNALTFGQGVDLTAKAMGKGDNFTACYGNSDSWAYRGGAVGGFLVGAAVLGGGSAGARSSAGGAAAAAEDGASITFGHGARHLAGTGLSSTTVEGAITAQVSASVAGASSTGSFWGRVMVNGVQVEYRAYTLADGTINVGTYYPLP